MRPRLLDLYCGAGGAAMGYQLAGFHVTGVDIAPQPNYAGVEFVQADARTFPLEGFDAIHASPPCQAHSTIGKQIRKRFTGIEHPDLVASTRELLLASGLPYVIENVVGAPLENAVMLCGSSFGLDVRRHRLFECSFPVMSLPCAHHWQKPRFFVSDKRRHHARTTVPVHGSKQLSAVVGVHGNLNYAGEKAIREVAMGIDWMSPYELTQAIPPAYTEHIGGYLMAAVQRSSLVAATDP